MVKLTWTYKDMESDLFVEQDDFIIGRRVGAAAPPVPLDLDVKVAPRHARVWKANGAWWVEDLGTPGGTFVDDARVVGRRVLPPGGVLRLGTSKLAWQEGVRVGTPPATGDTAYLRLNGVIQPDGSQVNITSTMPARQDAPLLFDTTREDSQGRIAQLLELPLLMAGEKDVATICRQVLNRVVELIPVAVRGAFLVYEPDTRKLAVRAGIPENDPPISRTLIRKAATDGCGFIWNSDGGALDPSASMKQHAISAGMYAPLMWQGEVMGILCVDNPYRAGVFQDEDLRFLMAVANYAASTLSNHHMQKRIMDYSVVLESLLTNFSPKLRGKLVNKARTTGLHPGGERSEVTLLLSDLRGFTKVCAGMEVEDVVAMLNDYFSVLVQVIFDHGGTVDKFIGDAILAVFGSPEADPDQHANAVRAALGMQVAMIRLNSERRQKGLPACDLGVGLHSGPVLHGFIGAKERLEFTVIGDAVNITSRLADGAGASEVIVSSELHTHICAAFSTEEKIIPIKHAEPMKVWRVVPPS